MESGAEGDFEVDRDDDDMSAKAPLGVQPIGCSGTVASTSALNKATIAVSDVDGRAFDILLR